MRISDALKFVYTAASSNSGQQAYAHFDITDGRVIATNGYAALSAPIDIPFNCKPKADLLMKAVAICGDDAKFSLTENGSLLVSGKSTRVTVRCYDGSFVYPVADPQGAAYDLDFKVIDVFKKIKPFISINEEPTWANTVLVSPNGCLMATDTMKILQIFVGHHIDRAVLVPLSTVDVLLKIGEEPTQMNVDSTSITFTYADSRYLRTALRISTPWPDLMYLLEAPHNAAPIPDDFRQAVVRMSPLVDGSDVVDISSDNITTASSSPNEVRAEFVSAMPNGKYSFRHLMSALDVAETADFSLYPKPVVFFGDNLRGAFIGCRPDEEQYDDYPSEA